MSIGDIEDGQILHHLVCPSRITQPTLLSLNYFGLLQGNSLKLDTDLRRTRNLQQGVVIIQRETRKFTDIQAITHFSFLSFINPQPSPLHMFNQVNRFTKNIFNSMINMGLSFKCRRLGFSSFLFYVRYHDNYLNSLCLFPHL